MADIYTEDGEELTADIITDPANHPGATGWYIGWGTGAGTAAKDRATLFTESTEEARVQVSSVTQPSPSINQWQATMTCQTSQKTITNAGVFNASTSGVLFLHSNFTGVLLDPSDSIQFTFQLEWL